MLWSVQVQHLQGVVQQKDAEIERCRRDNEQLQSNIDITLTDYGQWTTKSAEMEAQLADLRGQVARLEDALGEKEQQRQEAMTNWQCSAAEQETLIQRCV